MVRTKENGVRTEQAGVRFSPVIIIKNLLLTGLIWWKTEFQCITNLKRYSFSKLFLRWRLSPVHATTLVLLRTHFTVITATYDLNSQILLSPLKITVWCKISYPFSRSYARRKTYSFNSNLTISSDIFPTEQTCNETQMKRYNHQCTTDKMSWSESPRTLPWKLSQTRQTF